jgi:LysM repeat protein
MKIKLPKMFTAKPKRLRATAVRKPLRAATADYEEMAEPNMKLSRALLIVLVLHIVAVSGIIAFNAIKTRQNTAPMPAASTTGESEATKTESTMHPAATAKDPAARTETKAAHSTSTSKSSVEHKGEHGKSGLAADSGKTYLVAKGDTPVNIAKKLKVSYDELLAVNHIDDPHKLQIGQKLIIPKPPKAKKVDE